MEHVGGRWMVFTIKFFVTENARSFDLTEIRAKF